MVKTIFFPGLKVSFAYNDCYFLSIGADCHSTETPQGRIAFNFYRAPRRRCSGNESVNSTVIAHENVSVSGPDKIL